MLIFSLKYINEINKVKTNKTTVDQTNRFPSNNLSPKFVKPNLSTGVSIEMGSLNSEYINIGRPIPIQISKIFEP